MQAAHDEAGATPAVFEPCEQGTYGLLLVVVAIRDDDLFGLVVDHAKAAGGFGIVELPPDGLDVGGIEIVDGVQETGIPGAHDGGIVGVERVVDEGAGDGGRDGVGAFWQRAFGGLEDDDASTVEASFAVAASGSLDDAVERRAGAQDDGEIEVDTGFDDLGRNEDARLVCGKAAFDLADDGAAVRPAEQGRKVQRIGAVDGSQQGQGVFFGVDDDERLCFAAHERGDLGPGERVAGEPLVVDALEGGVPGGGIGDDVGGWQGAQGGNAFKGWLRSG